MKQSLSFFALAAQATAVFALCACSSAPSTVRQDQVDWQPARPVLRFAATDASAQPNVKSRFEPGTTIELLREPRADRGIPLPSGGFLPGLNGVVQSSRIDRPLQNGAVPAVVAVVVDESQLEWYRHQDGSMTTSRYVFSPAQKRWEAVTLHAIP
jgi:hypothetical protein